jgi:hypothetical protein
MLRRSFLALAAALALALPAWAADDPVARVRAMYDVQLQGEKTKKFVWDKPHLDDFFTRALARRIPRTRDRSGIDFDFILDGQDNAVKELSFALIRKTAAAARVEARFKNNNEPKRVAFHLVLERGAWRVSDISTTGKNGWVLTKLLDK